ncbi:hypothetical protein BDR04DRAFT_1143117 [Suillus decipiens]|nr:hypothetical protein BDR04DRAFT_1143117 [Suillus decipiens]
MTIPPFYSTAHFIMGIPSESIPLLLEKTGRVHNQRGRHKEPGAIQVTNYLPIISFSCNHGTPGHTVTNLKNSQILTIIGEPFVNANATAIDVPPGFDEWTISGLTKRICMCMDSMECKSQASTTYAHVKRIHMHKDILTGMVALVTTTRKQ